MPPGRLKGAQLDQRRQLFHAVSVDENGSSSPEIFWFARCAAVADVAHAVNFARDHGLLLSVRGGGHNVAGSAVCDGGLMIDLSQMKRIQIDARKRSVRADGGCTWRDLDHETAGFGL